MNNPSSKKPAPEKQRLRLFSSRSDFRFDHLPVETADLSAITNTEVRCAVTALQQGDPAWYRCFTKEPEMTDNGISISFRVFSAVILGHEKFISIDRVENNGKDIYGNFRAGQWGTFYVFYKFRQDETGLFNRLEVGLAKR